MKNNMISNGYYYLSFFQLFYITTLILLSYSNLENETIKSVIGIVGEIITIPVVVGVVFCLIYFGMKLFKRPLSKQYLLIFCTNALTAGLMVCFTILQT